MPFIEWDNSELLEIKILDKQHIEMISILNKLHQLLPGNARNKKRILIDSLITKIHEHFNTEENFMREYRFLNFISHKLEHDRVKNKLNKFKEDFESQITDINLEFLKSMKVWFFNHNKLNDKKMAAFLKENGVN